MSRARASLLVLWITLLALTPQSADAQPAPGRPQVNEPVPDTRFVPREPFIDRNVNSVLERFSAWKTRMKKEHFIPYLVVYTCFWSALLGSLYGFLAFRFGDAMAPYRRIRNKTGLLSLAVGAGLGVSIAVTQIPPTIPGKVTMLLMAVAIAVVATTIASLTLFVLQRWFMVVRARRSGFPLSGRLRVP